MKPATISVDSTVGVREANVRPSFSLPSTESSGLCWAGPPLLGGKAKNALGSISSSAQITGTKLMAFRIKVGRDADQVDHHAGQRRTKNARSLKRHRVQPDRVHQVVPPDHFEDERLPYRIIYRRNQALDHGQHVDVPQLDRADRNPARRRSPPGS